MKHYILVNRKPVSVSLHEWAQWFESANRRVARDEIGGVEISTVFIGLDHRFTGEGPPILFETMVFGGEFDRDMERYCTWDEAIAGHERWKLAVASMTDA